MSRDSLPKYVVLKSKFNNKYLRYVDDGAIQFRLQFTGENAVSPFTKFELERANSDGNLVHLRCCYNNKYWVRQYDNTNWILSKSDHPEEDPSKWNCTLFQPISVDVDGADFRFKHVQLGSYARLETLSDPTHELNNCLFASAGSPSQDLRDVCTVIDWESLVVLPKYVAFKGDNLKYLQAVTFQGNQNLHFQAEDYADLAALHQVFTAPDGSIRLMSNAKFWRCAQPPIYADSDDTTYENKNTLFWPVKLSDSVIALRSLGNEQFCKRLIVVGHENYLSASVSTISKEARLEVIEPVLSRSIYSIEYHLTNARIYNEQDVSLGSGEAANNTNDAVNMDVIVPITTTTTTCWSVPLSLKLGVKSDFQAGTPSIQDDKTIEVSPEITTSYEMGDVLTSTSTVLYPYNVVVPPMTKIIVRARGTTANCEIPFTYTQTDTLIDGRRVTQRSEDGVYTCINTFNITYHQEVEKKELDATKLFDAYRN